MECKIALSKHDFTTTINLEVVKHPTDYMRAIRTNWFFIIANTQWRGSSF